jgi:tellurite resistance protein TehA-like permease
MPVANLYPGYFALVMATGICSTALREIGATTASAVLLDIGVGCFAVLCVALGWRLIRYRRRVLDDLSAPDRAFAFFTVVAACDVLGARLAVDGHRVAAAIAAGAGVAVWLVLSYTVPVRLILGPRHRPVLEGVNGTWFIWVVGTESVAVVTAFLTPSGASWTRAGGLLAVSMWSVGLVLYLIVATLLLVRLLLAEVRPQDLTPPYWVTMGATAITVFAASRILSMAEAPAVIAVRPVAEGLGLMLWAFGTWLIPLLVAFGVWRHVLHRVRLAYTPALWSIVFPLGMYAVASMQLGAAAQLPIIASIGHYWTLVAVAAWATVFVGMCVALARSVVRALSRAAQPATSTSR